MGGSWVGCGVGKPRSFWLEVFEVSKLRSVGPGGEAAYNSRLNNIAFFQLGSIHFAPNAGKMSSYGWEARKAAEALGKSRLLSWTARPAATK